MAGLPKAAVVTHERVWAASFIQKVCGVTSEDIFYINLPLYHSAGFLIGMVGAIERGPIPQLRFWFKKHEGKCSPGLCRHVAGFRHDHFPEKEVLRLSILG